MVWLTSEVVVHLHIVVFLLALVSVSEVPSKREAEGASRTPTLLVACEGVAAGVSLPFACVEQVAAVYG